MPGLFMAPFVALPGIIDKLSPNGQLPQGGDVLSQGIDLLKGFLGGR